MHAVLETPTFADGAQRIGLSGEVLDRVIDLISSNPQGGEDPLGIDGLRCRRLSTAETGIDAELDVMFFFVATDVPIFLLDVYFSGEEVILTQQQRLKMTAELSSIADTYRANVRAKVLELRKGKNE
jgi:hypothetical protein